MIEEKVRLKSFTQLAVEGSNYQPPKKIWGNYILEKNLVLFPSERGVGKTFLMLQLALAVSNEDTEFCGEPIELPGNVLYLNFELGETMLKRRILKLKERFEEEKEKRFEAYSYTHRGNITEAMEDIIVEIKRYKPVLVILDNLRVAFSGLDNERNKDMTTAMTSLAKLKDEYGLALVIVHHTKKGSSGKITDSDLQSGAGALSDLVDADFFLRKSRLDGRHRILKRMKSRETEESDTAKLIAMNPETLFFEVIEEDVNEGDHIYAPDIKDKKSTLLEKAKELHKAGKSGTEIAKELDVNKSTISRWLKID